MTIHDKAYELARMLKEQDEYKRYKAAKDVVDANQQHRAMIDAYKKLQYKVQASVLSGGAGDSEEMEQLSKMAMVLQYNSEISAYLMAEYAFTQIVSDIYKIIGDASDIDMSFMYSRDT